MFTPRTPRTGAGLLALAALMFLLALNLGGCSDDDNSPTATPGTQAPALPNPELLTFDFDFFDGAETLARNGEKSGDNNHDNFVNAYLRAVVLEAMAQLTLAGPVGAFSLALHAVPEAQDDGAWIWTYDWNDYKYPVRLALRGLPAGDHVRWELRVGDQNGPPTALWFEGSTNGDGSEGHWLFHDLDDPAQSICGEISWGGGLTGNHLEFVSREDGSVGDTLRFTDADPDFSVEFMPGDESELWFIRWHNDGTGSLRVPDYNGGAEACWDRWQENVECE
ncbi:hypothetical protein DRQ50_04495 [bacterium]|nr:MAG: hypothetical protein DRQ50_04495 [bacterium]